MFKYSVKRLSFDETDEHVETTSGLVMWGHVACRPQCHLKEDGAR